MYVVSLRGNGNLLKLDYDEDWTIVTSLKTTKLFTLKGQILRYMNYISIKLLKKGSLT